MAEANLIQNTTSIGNNLDALATQLTTTTETIRNNPKIFDGLEDERARVILAAETLLNEIKPKDPIMTAMIAMVQFTAIRLFVEWKAFDIISKVDSISFTDLAKEIDAEASIIARFSAVLISTGVLKQVGNDHVSSTSTSIGFVSASPLTALIKMGFDDHLRTLHSMPAYFEQYGRKEPTGRYDTIYAYAAGNTNLTVWEHINKSPEKKEYFMTAMMAMASRMPTTGTYNFSWVLEKRGEHPERTLIVDVGGGKGHALQDIYHATPGLPMKCCVVEDLQAVVDEARATSTGELAEAQYIAMNFHTEQPIKGACIYYIRRCLHDYGDDVCVQILEQLCGAMADDSRVLIVEQILQDPPLPFAAASDIYMATLGGKERSLQAFHSITSRAGLKIAQVYPSTGSDVAVIECRKA
ncbi:O-methyltransferase [Mariannaea sp. PMI_226]|nr:O-methyltransferase [Mariannaea sp. PMI_226]